jgi:hypothetical protein
MASETLRNDSRMDLRVTSSAFAAKASIWLTILSMTDIVVDPLRMADIFFLVPVLFLSAKIEKRKKLKIKYVLFFFWLFVFKCLCFFKWVVNYTYTKARIQQFVLLAEHGVQPQTFDKNPNPDHSSFLGANYL